MTTAVMQYPPRRLRILLRSRKRKNPIPTDRTRMNKVLRKKSGKVEKRHDGLMRDSTLLGRMVCLLVTMLHLTATSRADNDDDRARQILAEMTLREKIDYLGGIHAMSIRPMPRLGLPEIRMSDGPLGVR